MRPIYKQFACPVHSYGSRPHLCQPCSAAVTGYRESLQAWRLAEAEKMRERVRPKPTLKDRESAQEVRMNATTWEQWFHGKWEYRMYRKARRTREIRAVYWSEVRPRHFRGAYHSKNRKAVLYKSSVGIEPTYRKRDFYAIRKLLRASEPSSF